MRSDRFGLSVHQHRGAWPTKDEQVRLGVTALRVLVVDQDRLLRQLADDLAPGVKVIALINSQTPGVNPPDGTDNPHGLAGWKAALSDFATRFAGKVHAVECLNEWDIGPKNTLDEVVQCVVDAAPLLHPAGIKCLLGSVGGGEWKVDLRRAIERVDELGVRDSLDGICTHPYLRPALGVPAPEPNGAWLPPEVHEAVQIAFDIANPPGSERTLPVYVTEYGLPMDPTDPGDLQADFVRNSLRVFARLPEEVLGAACYFSYSDRSGGGGPNEVFGLVRRDLTPRGGLTAFLGEAVGPTLA